MKKMLKWGINVNDGFGRWSLSSLLAVRRLRRSRTKMPRAFEDVEDEEGADDFEDIDEEEDVGIDEEDEE